MKGIPTWRCVVAVALRRPDGRWLMARRPPHKHHGGLWEFPGGKVETDEVPVNALVREAAEELGIAVSAADLTPAAFAESALDADGGAIVILLYTATRWRGEPAACEDGMTLGWFKESELTALAMPPLDVALCRALTDGAGLDTAR